MDDTNKMDLLNGPLLKKIIVFAIPIAIGSVLQQLFNMVDTAVVGRFASSEALAAVGANGPVVSLFVNFFVGLSAGSSVLVAGYIGSGRKDRLSNAVHTSVTVSLICGIFLAILVQFVGKPLLVLMSIPENIMDLGVLYLRIYALGMPFILLYNFGSAILRSVGDSKRPVYSLVIAGVINAVLNLILVVGFKRSVDGVAIATVVSNIVASGMVLRFLMKEKGELQFSFKKLGIAGQELRQILKVGVPAGLQGTVFSLSNVVIQSALNTFGSAVVAGSSVAANFEIIGFFVVNGFSQAAVTFVGQNYGAKQLDRCHDIWKISLACGLIFSALIDFTFVLCRIPLIHLFTSDPQVVEYASMRATHVLIVHWLIATYEITGSCLRGYGYSLTPALLTVFGTCIVRIGWVTIVNRYYHDFLMVLMVYPISWVITGILVIGAYFVIVRKIRREESIA